MAQSNGSIPSAIQQNIPTAEAPVSKMSVSVKRNSELEYNSFEQLHPHKKRKDVKGFLGIPVKSVEVGVGSYSSSQNDSQTSTDVRNLNNELIENYVGETKELLWKQKGKSTDVRNLNNELIENYVGETKELLWKQKEIFLQLIQGSKENNTRKNLEEYARKISDVAGNSGSALSGQISKNISSENIQISKNISSENIQLSNISSENIQISKDISSENIHVTTTIVENPITEENITYESVVQNPIRTDVKELINSHVNQSINSCNSSPPPGAPSKGVAMTEKFPLLHVKSAGTVSTCNVDGLNLQKHREALQYCCRMCCRRRRINSLKPAVLLKLYLSEKLMKDFTSENSDVYPTKFCVPCINKIKKFQKLSPEAPFPFQFHIFRPHDALCILCINEKVYQQTTKDVDVIKSNGKVTSSSVESKGKVTNSSVELHEGLGSILSDIAAIKQSGAKKDILEANKTVFKSYLQHQASNSSVDVNVHVEAAIDNMRESSSRPNKEVKEICIRQEGIGDKNDQTSDEREVSFRYIAGSKSQSGPSNERDSYVRPIEGGNCYVMLSEERESYCRSNERESSYNPNEKESYRLNEECYYRPIERESFYRPIEKEYCFSPNEREPCYRPNERTPCYSPIVMDKTNGQLIVERESSLMLNEQSIVHAGDDDEKDSSYKFDDYSTTEMYNEPEEVPVVGLPLTQVIDSQRKIAEVLSCFHCETVPLKPYISRCSHVFCKNCIGKVITDIHNCPNIGGLLKLTQRDISSDTVGLYKTLVSTFMFKCKNVCNFLGTAQDVLNHQCVCTMEMKDEMLGVCESETRLKIEKFLEYGDRYCEDNKVSQEFVLFYSLRRFLKLKGDKKRVALLMCLWEDTEELGGQLSPEDCLALRVSVGQKQKSYRYHYNFLKKHVSIANLRCPKQIELLEKMFYPPFTDFSIESQEGITLYKRVIDEVVEPSDLEELVSTSGFRWKFTAGIAKTLQELAFEFQDQLTNIPNAKFMVDMSDKYEKVKDVKLSKLRKNIKVPKYVIRYSFRILTISAVIDEQKHILYSSETAGALSSPRTLAVALPNECRKDNVKLLLHPIEEEKRNLSGKYLCVRLPNGMTGKFCLSVSSVIDYGKESLDLVSLGNLDVNEYGEFCMLCHTDKTHWLQNLGSFSITEDWKSCPSNYLMNPIQFDVNFIKLLNEVVVRESACVYRNPSECSTREKLVLRNALRKMQSFLLQEFDIQPDSLILEPEEYVKKFFTAWNRGGAVKLIQSKVKQTLVQELFWRYCELRSMYLDHFNSGKTRIIKVIKVKSFKSKAIIWINYLFSRFSYISPSSYLHLLVEHGEELIQLPGDPEFLSGTDKTIVLNPQVKSLLLEDLKNIWLKTSPYLRKKGRSYRKTTTCRNCSKRGHATKNCPKRKV